MRVGAHVSIVGGLEKSIERARAIGADCIQIFGSSPRSWKLPAHTHECIERFKINRAAAGIDPVFLHTIYLINLASGDHRLWIRSVASLTSYLNLAEALGAAGVVTHLGSGIDGEERVARALRMAIDEVASDVPVLLETSAGAGNCIGSSLESLGRIIATLDLGPRIQLCLDTAHVFAAGYDISSEMGLQGTLAALDREVGIGYLKLVHINDSKAPLGARVDRHANIGQGRIGLDAFARILHNPALRDVPFITEVPGPAGVGPGRQDVDALKRLASSAVGNAE